MFFLNEFFLATRKTLFLLLFLFSPGFLMAQETPDTAIEHFVVYRNNITAYTFPVTGRIVGTNLENVKAQVINTCSGQSSLTDNNGIYHIEVAAGDTLGFVSQKYTPNWLAVKPQKKGNINVILIRRKTEVLAPGYSGSDYKKAVKEDDELLRVLEKDAKAEGKWNY
jgi:hypothetical protein